jgi:hypothetical protein
VPAPEPASSSSCSYVVDRPYCASTIATAAMPQ